MDHASEKYVKITVSVPAAAAEVVREAVARGDAPSVSAYVVSAIERRVARERFHDKLMTLRDGKPFSQEALDWAYDTLGVQRPGTEVGQVAS